MQVVDNSLQLLIRRPWKWGDKTESQKALPWVVAIRCIAMTIAGWGKSIHCPDTSVCLSVPLSVRPPVSLSICLSCCCPSDCLSFCPYVPLSVLPPPPPGFPHTLSCTLFNTSLVPLPYVLRVPGDGEGPASRTSGQQVAQLTGVNRRGGTPRESHAQRPAEFIIWPAAGSIRAMSDVTVEVTRDGRVDEALRRGL